MASDPPDPTPDLPAFRAELQRLSRLDVVEYATLRKPTAARFGVTARDVDKAVQALRPPIRPATNGHTNGHHATAPPILDAAIEADAKRSPEYSDDALALAFSARHGAELRHVATWGKWLQWDGHAWREDNTTNVWDLARRICREHAHLAEMRDQKPAMARSITSSKTVASVEKLARSDRRHALPHDAFDADPWALNTPGGMVDVKTGRVSPHDSARNHSKITACGPSDAKPELWLDFLSTATAGDTELMDYLQRMAGYMLTGSIKEHAMFFAWGEGGNGKGTFINTLSAILRDYAVVAGIETFTATPGDHHPTDLAKLRGARLVTAQETEEGRRWAENRVKALTGGDPITARFMRQDFFTYEPQFKLLIAGNHKPGLRTVDAAIKRRFNLLPFSVKIPSDQVDIDLSDKLKSEWPAILGWAIEGCLLWQRIGLKPPPAVITATEEYLKAEDALVTWIEECCERSLTHETPSSALYNSWKRWAEGAGEFVGSQKRWAQSMESHGYAKMRRMSGVVFQGLRLNYSEMDPPPRSYGDDR